MLYIREKIFKPERKPGEDIEHLVTKDRDFNGDSRPNGARNNEPIDWVSQHRPQELRQRLGCSLGF